MTDQFATALLADGPSADMADAALFGQFVGCWDLAVTWFQDGAPVRRERGEWSFAWVLGGRAIQDVWIVPPLADQRRGTHPYEFGTSVRFPDGGGEVWHSTWHGPVNGLVVSFIARRAGDNIVLHGQHPDGSHLRWVFSEISAGRFLWRNEKSTDSGATWSMTQAFTATRRT